MEPALRLQIVREIEAALAGGPVVAVATVVSAGEPARVTPGEKLLVHGEGPYSGTLGDLAADRTIAEAARAMFTANPRLAMQTLYLGGDGVAEPRPSRAEDGDAEVMVQLFSAPARLVIVGGGHVGLATATIGEIAGFGVTVIDDRPEFANRERFPMAEQVIAADAEDALRDIEFDANTYVVLVSRGHRQDEEALRHTVNRGAAYVGMIGSKRRTSTILRHLEEEGVAAEALARVSTPIGLDIAAETPEEIAISILAEIIMLRRGGSGGRMRATNSGAPPLA